MSNIVVKHDFNIKQIKEGLRQCLVERQCSKCPYYIWFYNDDINEPGDRSCWGILQKDVDLILTRFEILSDND